MPGRYRSDTLEQRISIERLEQAVNIFGSFDENIRLLEQEFSVTVVNRDGELRVEGEPEDTMLACKAIQALLTLSSRGEAIGEQNVRYVIGLVRSGKESQITELTGDVLCISAKGRPIKPKTIGQKEYIKSVLKNTVTIGVGPAGTGKTYLAVAAAVQAFRDKQVNRIILTRPAVEAGERLGFLPGDLQSKVDPYLRPLYDALFDMLGAEGVDVPCEVDVLLTNDSGIHEINREMRQVDASTDVLSFPEFDLRPGELPAPEDADPGTGLVPLGDMVISMEHVAAQAREYGHAKRRELSYLVVHSVLHLLGYDHLDEGPQKARMRAREEAILGELGIGR